ncbi:hypothetical protein DFJ74DRAFT_700921 [Hyaloraphidium curvatum]|nr:hypothetical protein DFJ74DRAFT_700921 [Hyaloraphidium curvatum]
MADSTFEIYDSHHHLWLFDGDKRPGGGAAYSPVYTDADLVKDVESAGAKLVGSTYLQCFWETDPVGETEWTQMIADRTKNQVNTAVVGETNMLTDEATVEAHLKEHMKFKNFRGIRFCISRDDHNKGMHSFLAAGLGGDQPFADPQMIKNTALFAKYGLTFDAWCYGHQLPGLAVLAKACPDVNFVLDHFGTPLGVANDDAVYAKWQEDMAALAKLSNIYVKISGLMSQLGFGFGPKAKMGEKITGEVLAASRFGAMVEEALKLFGTDRCMFGSNFPVDGHEASYAALVKCYSIVFDKLGFTAEQKRKLWVENGKKFYRV